MNSEVVFIVAHKVNLGVRQLSSVLKSKGITPDCLFLSYDGMYTEDILEQIYQRVKESKFVGISLIESGINMSFQIVSYIRKRGYSNAIVLGGIFAMLSPRECIEYADVVCAFEGENIIYDLVENIIKGNDLNSIPGILYKKGGEIFETETPTKYVDINSLPIPDYVDYDNHYYIINERLVKMDSPERIRLKDEGGLDFFGSRGCSFKCTFCCSSELTSRCGGYRKKDIKLFLSEVEYVVSLFKNIKKDELHICIFDDNFISRNLSEIEHFSDEYRIKIGVPFMCLCLPINITKEKTQLLIDANVDYFYMSMPSGSEDVMKNLYNRPEQDIEQVFEHYQVLFKTIRENSKQNDIKVSIDFFINNILEKPIDKRKTIRTIMKIYEDSGIDYLALTIDLVFFSGIRITEDAIGMGYMKFVNRNKMISRGQVMLPKGGEYYKRNINFRKVIYYPSPVWDTILMFMAGWQTKERCGGLKRSSVNFLLRCRGLDLLDRILRTLFDSLLFVKHHLPHK